MKTRSTSALALFVACTAAQADPGVMIGASYDFGGSVGLTREDPR